MKVNILKQAVAACSVACCGCGPVTSAEVFGPDPDEGKERVVVEGEGFRYSNRYWATITLVERPGLEPIAKILVEAGDAIVWQLKGNLTGERILMLGDHEFELQHGLVMAGAENVFQLILQDGNGGNLVFMEAGTAKFTRTSTGFTAVVDVEPHEFSATVSAEVSVACAVLATPERVRKWKGCYGEPSDSGDVVVDGVRYEIDPTCLLIDEDLVSEVCAPLRGWR